MSHRFQHHSAVPTRFTVGAEHFVAARDGAPHVLQDAELLEAGRRLAEAQGALSVAHSSDAALAAAREEAAASRGQYQVARGVPPECKFRAHAREDSCWSSANESDYRCWCLDNVTSSVIVTWIASFAVLSWR